MALTTVRLTADGDLDVTDGRAHLLSGAPAVAQIMRGRFLAVRGEFVCDRTAGIELWEEILVSNPDLPIIHAIYARHAARTPGIATVNAVDLDFVGRTLHIEISAASIYGPVVLSELKEQ